jgi:alkylation response protein AidB-like acyl-CoA dehydrogenase
VRAETAIQQYRETARRWLEAHAATHGAPARRGLTPEQDLALGRAWMALKYDAGYSGINWPREHGGQGLGALEKLAFEEEEMKFGFPTDYFAVSLGMPVPIILRYLTGDWVLERAKAALRGEEIWCQLFSEPSGGSDLAGLRLRATRDQATGDWRLDGQKLWTSYAQYCDYGILVARHDPTLLKHQGLTYFWVDMRAPGTTVRPIKLADGSDHVNEVFFDNVLVPDSQRLGPVGGGFKVALETLVIERHHASDPAGFGPALNLFVREAAAADVDGVPLLEDGRVRERIARNYALQNGLRAIQARNQLMLGLGMEPGPEGAVNKLVSARARQRLSEFVLDLRGAAGVTWEPSGRLDDWVRSWISAPTGRQAGGSDEMLLNTIAERILGLPQDHRPDKGVPFNQIPK